MVMPLAYAKLLMMRERREPLGLYEAVRQELRAWRSPDPALCHWLIR